MDPNYGRNLERQVADLRARIAAVRSRFGWTKESTQIAQTPRVQHPPERPKEEKRVEPRVEPDWDAINKLTAINDAKEAKAGELNAMKAKLMGKK
jgi:hypothetical protein